jgi:CBS domain-containing protein
VYDYVAGKQDWMAAGLPIEGENAAIPRAGDLAARDVPTCGLGDRVGDVRKRIEGTGWNACVVVNTEKVVLGLLRSKQLAGGDDERVEDVMRPGPGTFRPNVPIDEMARYMIEHDLESAPVTTPDGKLVGMLRRRDAAEAALELHRHQHGGEEKDA